MLKLRFPTINNCISEIISHFRINIMLFKDFPALPSTHRPNIVRMVAPVGLKLLALSLCPSNPANFMAFSKSCPIVAALMALNGLFRDRKTGFEAGLLASVAVI